MNNVDEFVHQPAEWLRATGPASDIVVSSRIRLARNIAGYPFLQKIKEAQRKELVGVVQSAVAKSERMKDAFYLRYNDLTDLDRQFLVERHLVSREHAEEEGDRAVAISSNEVVSLMVIEEDHLRLQIFQSGFNLLEAWRIASGIDDELEKNLNYSFSATLGYLTACPTNVGSGLRASCMVHLPGLVLTKQVQKVLQALAKLNLAVRGLYGEGTQATGNLFQFSNQITLGQQEEEIIDNLECVIRQVVEHEKEARQYLRDKRKAKYEDQFWRSLGVLKSARVISSQEATQLLSLVQIGIHGGLVKSDLTIQDLNSLFLLIQPAHLQKLANKILSAGERDVRRAELIRERLVKVSI
ncbi:MAG: protein arginine kinase [Candidatus Omnitrophica bacterium]|nr:protein arginine kinase [Candidatus Omnitrophota bacterium]MDD5671404.1 protein arginine kinase [Candidatus Omnitrophota bacterium]